MCPETPLFSENPVHFSYGYLCKLNISIDDHTVYYLLYFMKDTWTVLFGVVCLQWLSWMFVLVIWLINWCRVILEHAIKLDKCELCQNQWEVLNNSVCVVQENCSTKRWACLGLKGEEKYATDIYAFFWGGLQWQDQGW